MFNLKKYDDRNNLSIHKTILKIIIPVQKFLQKIFDSFTPNLIPMEHFEIYILKLIKKLISRKLADQSNWNFVCCLFP